MRTIGKELVLAISVSGIAAFSAKQTALRPSFEVASVKPAPPDVRADRVELLPMEDVDRPEFARDLTSEVGRPVLDRTGIQGHFDLELPPFLGPDLLGTPSSTPSIFNVLEDQLGLRLESTRALIEVYVVDHIQRPTEN